MAKHGGLKEAKDYHSSTNRELGYSVYLYIPTMIQYTVPLYIHMMYSTSIVGVVSRFNTALLFDF